ncbi:MAG: hypothetical protein GX247_00045 [Mollicutes bacterium]|nr:hypothetical protein [Mollicutes bacterium]
MHKVQLPKDGRPKPTNKIMFESEEFLNGFKVVVMSNGEYAYIREEDNCDMILQEILMNMVMRW